MEVLRGVVVVVSMRGNGDMIGGGSSGFSQESQKVKTLVSPRCLIASFHIVSNGDRT